MKRYLLLSTVLATVLFLNTGCNVENDTNSTTTETNTISSTTTSETVSGIVADGYIKGATVCIDLNNNSQCDSNEPVTITNDTGNYTLSYEGDINGKSIIATGGFDINRSVDFNSTLVSVIENGVANITPITTFTYFYALEKNMSFDQAKGDVAKIFGIESNEIDADPVKNEALEKISLTLQLAAETAAKLEGQSPVDIYKTFANKASSDMNFTQIVDNSFDNENIKEALYSLMNQIDSTTDITNLQNIENNIVNIVNNANENNITLNEETISNTISNNSILTDLNLSKVDFDNKISSLINEATIDANISNVATINDVKNLVSVIRDTTYEFLDPNIDNQENNTSTIAGEVIFNYNSAIKPAIDNVSTDINNSIDLINKAVNQFDEDFNNEFNQSLTDLNNRLQAISNVLSEYNETTDFNETTDYNDIISHTYSEDNGYITETYTLNGKTLTVKYYENKAENAYLATDPVTLSKDGEYNISLNSLTFDGNKFDFNISGIVYDKNDTSKKIEISNATLSFDLNATQFDNSIDKALTFSNINLNITGDVITNNGTFNGEIVLNDSNKYLKGALDYSNFNGVKIDGTLTINVSTNDLLKMINDEDLKYENEDWYNRRLVLINGSPIVEINESWNNDIEDINLTALNGEVAHCTITNTDINGTIYHTANCDKNVTEYYTGDKVVRANIDGKDVYLINMYKWEEYDENGIEVANIGYEFKDAFGNTYNISKDSNVSISNILVQNPTTVLDVSGDIKLSGNVQTPKVNLTLNLTAQSNADGKTYHVIAEDVNLTDGNNFAFVKNLDVGVEENKYKYLEWFSSYIIPDSDLQYLDPDYKKDNTTSILLQGFNAKLYDTNNNPISINDANVLADLNNNSGYIYGNLAYLDFNMTGFVGYVKNDLNNSITLYLDVERDGYEPFILGANGIFNNVESSINGVINKGNYLLYLNQNYINVDNNLTIKGYDSNGVFINVTKQGNNEANITITDKDGNSLATFDPKTNTITYNDGTSETLY